MSSVVRLEEYERFNDRKRKKMQHDLKIYMEKYFKAKLGKGVDHTRIMIWEDTLIIRGEGFLTEPEKYIVATTAARMWSIRLACRLPNSIPSITCLILNSFLMPKPFTKHI